MTKNSNWSHKLKRASSHYYENVKHQVERRTLNHWHDTLGTYSLGYQIDNGWITNWSLYSNGIIRGGTVWSKSFETGKSMSGFVATSSSQSSSSYYIIG